MGYPMTWKRLLHRNGLTDGDYTTAPQMWGKRVNTRDKGMLETDDALLAVVAPSLRERVEQYDRQSRNFAGDLRRLELDARDEGAVCAEVARRTGIEADTVAAVLAEFMAF